MCDVVSLETTVIWNYGVICRFSFDVLTPGGLTWFRLFGGWCHGGYDIKLINIYGVREI